MTTPFKGYARLRGKSPKIDHVETSVAMKVRDGILARIQAMNFFSGFFFGSNVSLQVQPDFIPWCGVYIVRELLMPDGDANVGEVRFRSTCSIGISVIIQNDDGAEAERTLDKAYQTLMTYLMTDNTLYDNRDFKIQAFSNGSRTHVFGSVAKDNETPMAELRLELNCDLGTITYEPQITDNFETIHETTFPPGYDDQTTPVVTVIDVDQ